MSDFDDLRQIREAKENTEALARQKKLEDKKQQIEAAQYLEDRKRAAANKLNDTVMEVLEALRDAIYPGYEVEQSFGWTTISLVSSTLRKTVATSPTSPTCAIAPPLATRPTKRSARCRLPNKRGSRRPSPAASQSPSLATDQSSIKLQLDGSLL